MWILSMAEGLTMNILYNHLHLTCN